MEPVWGPMAVWASAEYATDVLSIVLPTFNEAEGLPGFLASLGEALRGLPHEVIVVDDDSPDRTWSVAEGLQGRYPGLRVLRRVGRRGLSSAVMEGLALAGGDVLIVMDSDGQHDPAVLPAMVRSIEEGAGAVVASRYMTGGSIGTWQQSRRLLSKAGTLVARITCGIPVADPLSGFFALRKDVYLACRDRVRPTGFKILLEFLAWMPPRTSVREVPLQFRERMAGESKLTSRVQRDFAVQILRLVLLRRFPVVALWAFVVVCGLLFALLLPRALALSPLVADADARAKVHAALQAAGEREGWLLSWMQVRAVTSDAVFVDVRRQRRGADHVTCMRIPLDLSPPQPCVEG